METILAGIALGVGLFVGLLSYLVPTFAFPHPPTRMSGLLKPTVLAILVLILFFIVALQSTEPLSSGQRLAWGLLIGGVFALFAALGAARLQSAADGFSPYQSTFTLSLALSAATLVFLLFKGNPADAFAGCAAGFLLCAIVFRLSQRFAPAVADEPAKIADTASFTGALEAAAFLSVTLAAGCSLAARHYDSVTQRGWWAYLLVLAAAWLLGIALVYFASAQKALSKYPFLLFILALAVAGAVSINAGGILAGKLLPPGSLYWLLLVGFATALLSAWLALSAQSGEEQWPRALQAPALSVILLVFLLALSFRLSAGFGAAVALLAGWAVAAVMLGFKSNAAHLPAQMLAVGAHFLLLRLFLERTGIDLGEIDISLHYTLMGMLLGILLPFVLSSLYLRQSTTRTLLIGLPAVASPLIILAFWGPDAVLGLLVGLIAAQAFSLMLSLISQANPLSAVWQAPVGLLAMSMALLTVQFSRPFVFLYELSQAQKIYLAGAVAILAILWVFILGLAKLRRRAREILASRSATQEAAK